MGVQADLEMTTTNRFSPAFSEVVESAARQLVSVRQLGDSSYVNLPLFYPSGGAVTIVIGRAEGGFRVSDGGFAYRELEMIGAEHMFGRNAESFATAIEAKHDKRQLYMIANVDQLVGAIAEIGSASARLAHKVADKVTARNEAEIAAALYDRLVKVFGPARVEPEAKLVGASTKEWDLSALVRLDDRMIAFEAVANHHSSVYSATTMFHDLALLERQPVRVAVVRDKKAMGAYLGMLSQAAHVIQDNQPDQTFEQVAA